MSLLTAGSAVAAMLTVILAIAFGTKFIAPAPDANVLDADTQSSAQVQLPETGSFSAGSVPSLMAASSVDAMLAAEQQDLTRLDAMRQHMEAVLNNSQPTDELKAQVMLHLQAAAAAIEKCRATLAGDASASIATDLDAAERALGEAGALMEAALNVRFGFGASAEQGSAASAMSVQGATTSMTGWSTSYASVMSIPGGQSEVNVNATYEQSTTENGQSIKIQQNSETHVESHVRTSTSQ